VRIPSLDEILAAADKRQDNVTENFRKHLRKQRNLRKLLKNR
jgi:hypothetical protein